MVVVKPFLFAAPDRIAFLKKRFFTYSEIEHPIGLQLAGNDPKEFAHCAKIAEKFLFDEINLNIGCPSPRVQSGEFGVCLMKQPELVCDCIKSIKNTVDIPVSIKTRLGVDECNSYGYLLDFIGKTHEAGCAVFMIHARLADLSKTVRVNRSHLPLQYETVYRLKKDFPEVTIIINGDIKNTDEIKNHLDFVDGVMVGRALYRNPLVFNKLDSLFFGEEDREISREMIADQYLEYMKKEVEKGERPQRIQRHLRILGPLDPAEKMFNQ